MRAERVDGYKVVHDSLPKNNPGRRYRDRLERCRCGIRRVDDGGRTYKGGIQSVVCRQGILLKPRRADEERLARRAYVREPDLHVIVRGLGVVCGIVALSYARNDDRIIDDNRCFPWQLNARSKT